jgi:hypothetical protein
VIELPFAVDLCPCVEKLRTVLPLTVGITDSAVQMVSTLGSVVISCVGGGCTQSPRCAVAAPWPEDERQLSLIGNDTNTYIEVYNSTGCPDEDWSDVCSISQACVQNQRGWIWRIPSRPVIRDNPVKFASLPRGGVYSVAVGVAHNGVPIYSPYDASGEVCLNV